MTQSLQQNHEDELLDLYLDGLLVGEELAAFERRLADDTLLRAQVRTQHAVNESLRWSFTPPAPRVIPTEVNGRGNRASAPPTPPRGRRDMSRRMAIAAVLGLGLVGVWRIWTFLDPPKPRSAYGPKPKQTLVEAWQSIVAGGFKPDWVCETQERASRLLRRRFGQGLLLAESPSLSGIGWSYTNTITPNTAVLLVRANQSEILVFVDRLASDTGQSVPAESGLRLDRRELGELVLYELSRPDAPLILDRFLAP